MPDTATKTRHYKVASAEFKSLDEDEPGSFQAYYAVFGNVDYANDRIRKGAFANSLARWREGKDQVGVIFSHGWDRLEALVGWADPKDIVEDDIGLLIKGQLDMEDPAARKVHRFMQKGVLTQGSFAYDVVREETAKDGVNELLEIDLIEAGPCLRGMNPATRLVDIKSVRPMPEAKAAELAEAPEVEEPDAAPDEQPTPDITPPDVADEIAAKSRKSFESTELVAGDYSFLVKATAVEDPERALKIADEVLGQLGLKSGRVLSRKNESALREANQKISGVLEALEKETSADDDEAKATTVAKGDEPLAVPEGDEPVEAKPDEPDGAKSEEPPATPSLSLREAELALLNLG